MQSWKCATKVLHEKGHFHVVVGREGLAESLLGWPHLPNWEVAGELQGLFVESVH